MKINLRRITYPIAVVLAGIFLTLATYAYQPKEWVVAGNVCDDHASGYCFDDLPRAGFPLPYLHANAFASPYNTVTFFDDIFHPMAFIIDAVILSVMVDFVTRQVQTWIKMRKRSGF